MLLRTHSEDVRLLDHLSQTFSFLLATSLTSSHTRAPPGTFTLAPLGLTLLASAVTLG